MSGIAIKCHVYCPMSKRTLRNILRYPKISLKDIAGYPEISRDMDVQ